jgi:hypothetical protein
MQNPSFPGPEQQSFNQPSFAPQGPPGAAPPQFAGQQFPPGSMGGLPPRPAGNIPPGAPPGLPQRPTYQGGFYNGTGAPPPGFSGNASTIDELVSGAAAQQGDDIDQLIRMAEAGIKPPKKGDGEDVAVAAPAVEEGDKKAKKEKGRMVYSDTDVSPEERMAQLPRYAYVPGQ